MRSIHLHPVGGIPDPLRRFWLDTLGAQDPAGLLTSSPEWFEAMAWGDEARHGILEVTGADGRDTAVLPLLRRALPLDFRAGPIRLLRRPLDVMQACGGDLVAARGTSAADLAGAWRLLLEREPGIEGLWFGHVASADRARLLLDSCQGSGFFGSETARALPHFRMRLAPTLQECLDARSAKSLQRLRSKERALERELGAETRVVEIRRRDDWLPYCERIETLMNASWQAEVLGQRFSMDSFNGAAEHGWLRAFLLLAGDRALAFTLYFQGKGVMVSGVLGYDRQVARFSPGALLFLHTLERIYERDRPDWLDFGEGDAEYKRQWATGQVDVSSVLLVRRTIRLRSLFLAQRGFRAVRECVRGCLRMTGLERRLAQKVRKAGED